MMRSSLLLLACLTLVMAAGEADAREPEWNYTTEDWVTSISISEDGEYLAAGSDEDRIYLFDKDSSTPLWSYETEDNMHNFVAISADGEYIAAGNNAKYASDGTFNNIYLFDKDSSTPLWNYTTGTTNDDSGVLSIAISGDGEYIAAGLENGMIYFFNKNSSTPLWNYTTDSDMDDDVNSISISEDGEYIAAGSTNSKIYLFDKDSNSTLWIYHTNNNVLSVVISADGEYIAAGTADTHDSNLFLFDKDSGTPLWKTELVSDARSVAISADGEYITAGTDDGGINNEGNVYLFDKDSSTYLWNYTLENTCWASSVQSVSISGDGNNITATFGKDWTNDCPAQIYSFGKNSSTPYWDYTSDEDNYGFIAAISADGEYIVAYGCIEGEICKVFLFEHNIAPMATINSISPSPARFDDMEVTFNGSGFDTDGNVAGYEWISDIDGFLSDEEDFTTTGFSVGNHTITFRVQDNNGDWSELDDAELDVYPNAPPIAAIDSITPSPARFDAEVTFNGTGSDSDGNVTEYEWISDIDGFLSDKEDFSTIGFSVGYHTITFRVQDNDGDWSSNSTTWLEIYPNVYPVATIDSITPSPARFDAEVTFSGSGSDSDGNVTEYEWISDIDGFLSDDEDFSITGLSIDYHTITFRVQDNDGDWSYVWTMLQIYPNAPPVATIYSITPLSARFDAEVTFSGSGSDSDGNVTEYEWISDIDGFLSDDEDFSITGLSIDYHTITFRVQDNDGEWSEWDSAVLEIYPNAPPVGTIDSIELSPAEKGDEVTFNGTGSDTDGTIVAYQWESSIDGELSTDEDFSNNNLSLGHHTISFQVQDNDGDWSSDSEWGLWIYAVPVAIAGDDVSATPTVPVQFNGQGTDEDGTIAKYEWDFDGNGVYDWSSTENGRELNIYNNKGTYTAMLRVTDNDGFTNTDTVVITVTEKIIQIDDDGNITVTDAEEDEEGIPTLSVITTMAAVAVMALRRRPE